MTTMTRRTFLFAGSCLAGAAALPPSAPAQARTATRTIRHALGEASIGGAPARVITLDARHTENVLALGLQPVGMAGRQHYLKLRADAVPLPDEGVADLGLSDTPNIELIMTLRPDLILGNARSLQKNYPILNTIAPTLAFDPYPPGGIDQYANMVHTFGAVAQALGRQAAFEAFTARAGQAFAEGRARLAAAGRTGRKVVLGNVNAGITGADVMLFNDNSLPAEVLRRLGFDYAYGDPRHRQKGFHVTTAEALPALQHVDFLYLPFNEAGVRNLMNTPVWRNLAFVREGRVWPLTYREMYRGPLTALFFTREVVSVLDGR